MSEKQPLVADSPGGASYSGSMYSPQGTSIPSQGPAAGQYPPYQGQPQQQNYHYSEGGGSLPAGAVPPGGAFQSPGVQGQEAEPSAPPPESMDQLPGYSNIGFEGADLPPPSYEQCVQGPPPTRENIQSATLLSENDARDAIIQHVNEHCCYGKGPATEMKFTNMVSSSAFHYTLETFAEARSTKWTSQPYRGEGLVVTGPPPGPWDIQMQPPVMFKTTSVDIEVPNTASVKPCFTCGARGYKTCFVCLGRGNKMCLSCNGSGRSHNHGDTHHHHHHGSCPFCQGGYQRCYSCNGSGQHRCHKCEGRGNLRWFILLTIKWTNHVDDHIVERTRLPDSKVRKATGKTAFEETNTRVWPINHFQEQEINSASNNLVSRHGSQFTTERILMQRHRVRIIPVTEVSYHYKDQNSSFIVYGEEHRVYAPDYPAKCCCGCSIL